MSPRGGVHKIVSQERSSGLHTYGGNHRGPYQEKISRPLYNNNPPWLPHHHRFPPQKKRETLRIMGSVKNWCFGHPRSQFSLRKTESNPLFFGRSQLILREQIPTVFWSRKSSAVIGRYPEFSPADAPILSLRIGSW